MDNISQQSTAPSGELTPSELVMNANSIQVLTDYLQNNITNFSPPFNPVTALEMVRSDPFISGMIDGKVAKSMEGGYGIVSNSKTRQKKKEDYLNRDLRFGKVIRNIMRVGSWQDVLIEVVKKGDNATDLNLLDSAQIDVIAEPNGDIIEWRQKPNQLYNGVSVPAWKPEQVIHIKFKDAILNVWGENELRAAYTTLLIKDNIRKFLLWLFQTNQFRSHFNFAKGSSELQIKNFMSMYKQSESTYGKPVISEGEVKVSPIREIKDLDLIVQLLDWCNKELVALMPSTTVNLGLGGSGGRSESDSLGDVNRSYIKEFQSIVTEAVNYDILPRLGMFNKEDEFYFRTMDRMTIQKIFETVQIMRNSGFKDDAIKEYMADEGLVFDTEELFEPNEQLKANKDLMPSRISTKDGEADKNVGTGSESTTRPDQLVSHAEPVKPVNNWNFPFIVEDKNVY